MATQNLILTIGDEHSILTHVVGKKVKNAWQTSEDPYNAIKELRDVFEKNQEATIYILVDTIEQTFNIDELASTNYFQQKKIVDRHVKVTFPGRNLRASLPMGKAKTPGKKKYLLAAVPLNEKIEGWLKAIAKLPQTFGGVYSLPLESNSITKKITKCNKNAIKVGNTWNILITINITGGTRQIVSNGDKIALSRITKISSLNITEEELVEGLYRDYLATLSYIKRLDYSNTDDINITFIVSNDIKDYIHVKDWNTTNIEVFTPSEAAEALDLAAVSGKEDYFCDMLHATWFSSKKRKYLRLISSEVTASDKSAIDPVKLLLPIGIVVTVSMAAFSTYLHMRNIEAEKNLPTLQAELTRYTNKNNSTKKELKKLPYKRDDMEEKLITYENLIKNSEQINIAKIITRLDTAINRHMAATNLELIELKIDAIAQEKPPKNQRKKQKTNNNQLLGRKNRGNSDNMVSQINDNISNIKENISDRWKRVMRRKEATSTRKNRYVNNTVVERASQIEINIDKGVKIEVILQMPANIIEPMNAERIAGIAKEKLSRSFSDMSITELSTLTGYQARKITAKPYTCKFIIIGEI
ncbi:MAG: hypothetical protein GY804_05745 [Alphaproteobacteria bacterium]|nr:hypothetical protein [Alphaproteobacteria bacterium]